MHAITNSYKNIAHSNHLRFGTEVGGWLGSSPILRDFSASFACLISRAFSRFDIKPSLGGLPGPLRRGGIITPGGKSR